MAARKKVTKKATKTKKTSAKAKAPAKTKAKAPAKTKAKAPAKTKAKAPAKAKAKAPAKSKAKAPAKTKAKAKAPAAKAKAKAPAAKAKAPAPKAAKAAGKRVSAPAQRRDATGHLNPKYAADLRARSRESREDLGNDDAFLRKGRAHDSLAEELGEEAVATMTSGEDQSERLQDLEVEEERGGPFVTTTARQEYALGTDKSNPRDGTREPFPRT